MSYNQSDFYSSERRREQYGEQVTLGAYTAKTFLWMFAGLLVTFVTAVLCASSAFLYQTVYRLPYLPFLLLIVEMLIVFNLAARIQSLSVSAARGLFLLYAVLNGVMFSTYFILFDMWVLTLVFGMTALFFGALALYGFFTRSDLSRIRPILVGGLFFLLAFGLLSFFLNLSSFDTVVCFVGIGVFLGFTAYDTQKIRALHAAYAFDPVMAKKASIFAALQLYLDFINLFLYLLRVLGNRRS